MKTNPFALGVWAMVFGYSLDAAIEATAFRPTLLALALLGFVWAIAEVMKDLKP